MIATGQKSKTFHKEELTMSETERRIKRNVEEHAKLQQKKRTVQQQQQQSHSQSARATSQRRENKVDLSLPSPYLFLSLPLSLPPSLLSLPLSPLSISSSPSLSPSLSFSLSSAPSLPPPPPLSYIILFHHTIGLKSVTYANTQVIH